METSENLQHIDSFLNSLGGSNQIIREIDKGDARDMQISVD